MDLDTFDKAKELEANRHWLQRGRDVIARDDWLLRACDMAGYGPLPAPPEIVPPHILRFRAACLDDMDTRLAVINRQFEEL